MHCLNDNLSCFLFVYSAWIPTTVQKQVHYFVVILTLSRFAFFLVTIFSWSTTKGEITRNKITFYGLDEFSTVIFFSLTCVLALFWAEVYYIAVDHIYDFRNVIRPVIYLINIAAYITIGISCYLASAEDSDTDYIYLQYSIQISVLYITAAGIFGFYAYQAASQLNLVPTAIVTRKERTEALSNLTFVFIFALLVRAILILVMTDKTIETLSIISVVLMFAYYVLLELVPTIFAVIFYRVGHIDASDYFDGANSWETQPLNNSTNEFQQRRDTAVGDRTSSNIDSNNPNRHSDEIIASLIDKLSDPKSAAGSGKYSTNQALL